MAILEKLDWLFDAEEFTPEQRKILLALSNDKWEWRTLASLKRATRLSSDEITTGLKGLMEGGKVRASLSGDDAEPIFGLVERVGPGRLSKAQSKF